MLPTPNQKIMCTHWGTYRAEEQNGRVTSLCPIEVDTDPSPLSNGMLEARTNASRILRPAVRQSFLQSGVAATGKGRGAEPFVEVSWETATQLAAQQVDRVRASYGNGAIFGGSYGWASAGRFHHAQSQVHRFLNCAGGYVRQVQNYSIAAAQTIMPHVVGDHRGLETDHTNWNEVAEHTELIVAFGGLPHKNAQVSSGGVSRHILKPSLAAAKRNGAELVSISPIKDDTEDSNMWLPIRPNTDVALMLALAHTLVLDGLVNRAFLDGYTVGYARFEAYLLGGEDGVAKDAAWAATICDIPAETIQQLARKMAQKRTMLMMALALQRADHGEQPCWMLVTLAAMLGQIGLPGGGFGIGYGAINGIGDAVPKMAWPSLPQGENPIDDYIPVARIADMLLHPGAPYQFNGQNRAFPDIKLVYWAGGNPFHHHQDINRLRQAWQQPECIIVNEMFWNPLARHADIVFPATMQIERNDLAAGRRDRILAANQKLAEPAGEARNDYQIFAGIAEALGYGDAFTQGRDEEAWLRQMYEVARERGQAQRFNLPQFDDFWRQGYILQPEPQDVPSLFAAFRADPTGHPLSTPSGKIEIWSETIAQFGYQDCPPHPTWLAPYEWLGAEGVPARALHLVSNQPKSRLHSQLDSSRHSRESKIKGREPIRISPADAAQRGISDGAIVRVFNARGACLAAAVLSDALRPGVVQLSTGAWYDPIDPAASGSLDKHGNPNVLTRDKGTSSLAQGPSPHTCLVEVEPFVGPLPAISVFAQPKFADADPSGATM